MSSFDYNAPAELFLAKPIKGSRTKYRRFATAAEALRYAVEDLRTPKVFGTIPIGSMMMCVLPNTKAKTPARPR